jgi:hypothetical protein
MKKEFWFLLITKDLRAKNKLEEKARELILKACHKQVYEKKIQEIVAQLELEVNQINQDFKRGVRLTIEVVKHTYRVDIFIGSNMCLQAIQVLDIHSETLDNVNSLEKQLKHLLEENEVLMNRVRELQLKL